MIAVASGTFLCCALPDLILPSLHLHGGVYFNTFLGMLVMSVFVLGCDVRASTSRSSGVPAPDGYILTVGAKCCREDLCASVVLSGNTTIFQGIGERVTLAPNCTIDLASSDGLAGMKVDNDRLGQLRGLGRHESRQQSTWPAQRAWTA